MKASVVNSIGGGFDYAEDVNIADPIRREVLIDVKASGLCHTDVLMASNDIFPIPAVFGHEVAGVVTEVGPEVSQFQAGDHVVATLTQSCGTCARCLGGRSFQCTHPDATLRGPFEPPRLSRRGVPLFQGMGIGGFAEQALIHENQLAPLPAGVPFAQGALLGCGGRHRRRRGPQHRQRGRGRFRCGLRRRRCRPQRDQRSAHRGRVTNHRDRSQPAAPRCGQTVRATDVIDSSTTDPVGGVRDVLPNGADHVFDFVGVEAVADATLAMLGVGGGLYLIGVTRPDASFRFSPMDAIAGQKRAEGVNYGSTNFKRDIPMYAEPLPGGPVEPRRPRLADDCSP